METKLTKVKDTRNQVDISSVTVTSADLFSIQPVYSRQIIPDDNFNLAQAQFNRVDSLPVPAFVKVRNRMDYFYTKYSQVWKPFDAYNTQKPYAAPTVLGGSSQSPYSNVIPTELPYVSVSDLFRLFTSTQDFSLVQRYQNPTYVDENQQTVTINTFDLAVKAYRDYHAYDFIYLDVALAHAPSTIIYGYKLTPLGAKIWSFFVQLGLKIPNVIVNSQVSYYNDLHLSLMPLLCYLSIKLNYYTPLKFRDYSFVNSLSYLVDPYPEHKTSIADGSSIPYDYFNSANNVVFWNNVLSILCNVYYGSDYFTDSAISVYGPNATYSFHDPCSETYTRGVASSATPPGVSFSEPMIRADVNNGGYNATNNYNVTQYLLYALKALTSEQQIAAMTKNDLVAAATSLFGYKPEVADMVPYHLCHENDILVVNPETSQADTFGFDANGDPVGATLGYKAGEMKGSLFVGNRDNQGQLHPKTFNFETNGQLIGISSISPDIMYTCGINRELLNTTRKLFYDSNLARMGYQAVGLCELTLDIDQTVSRNLNSSFGLKPKFSELAYRFDIIGGMFSVPTLNAGLDTFHFNRIIDGSVAYNDETFALARSRSMSNSSFNTDGHQFNRVFAVADGFLDHIQQWNLFDVKARRNIVGKNDFTIGDDYDGKEIENKSLGEVLNA